MLPRLIPSTAALALLAGCATSAGPAPRLVDVSGPVAVAQQSGAYTIQATRVPYEYARLDHIDVYLKDVTAAGTLTKIGTLAKTGTGDADHTFPAVKFNNLLPRHQYSAVLRAFQADPGQGGTVVEVTDGAGTSNFVDSTTAFDTNDATVGVTTGANDSVTVAGGFKLKLADQTFNGLASGNVTPTNGQLKGTGTAPTLVITP